jgi:hypothetical protein
LKSLVCAEGDQLTVKTTASFFTLTYIISVSKVQIILIAMVGSGVGVGIAFVGDLCCRTPRSDKIMSGFKF